MREVDTMLPNAVVLDAIHSCYALECISVEEEYGSAPSGVDISSHYPMQPAEVMLPIAWRYLGRIEQAWGYSIGLVFHHMGLETEEDQAHALTDLLLGCMGHGVSLSDDYEGAFAAASAILNRWAPDRHLKPRPIHWEGSELRELAEETYGIARGTEVGTYTHLPEQGERWRVEVRVYQVSGTDRWEYLLILLPYDSHEPMEVWDSNRETYNGVQTFDSFEEAKRAALGSLEEVTSGAAGDYFRELAE